MGGVGSVPVVLIGGEAVQHEVAQVVFGDDPRGPSSIQGHCVGPSQRVVSYMWWHHGHVLQARLLQYLVHPDMVIGHILQSWGHLGRVPQ